MSRIMYDSVTAGNLPAGGDLYAGYDDGSYANTAAIQARFPDKKVVAVTVNHNFNGGIVLDVETGDATPSDAPPWVQMRRAAGVDPTVYCSEAIWPTVRAAFRAAGVPEPHYWVAAYPGAGPGVPAGAIAHQYADAGPYDVSTVADYWPGVDAVAPPPPLPPANEGATMDCDVPGGGILACRADGGVFAYEGAAFHGSLPSLHVTPSAPIVGICATSSGQGYWLVDHNGDVYAFGDAPFLGPIPTYQKAWNIQGRVTGVVRGNAAGVTYTVVADLGGGSPSLYGITSNGQYAKA